MYSNSMNPKLLRNSMRPLKRFLVLFVVRMTLYKINKSIANEQKNCNHSVRNLKLLDTLTLRSKEKKWKCWNIRIIEKNKSLIKRFIEVMPTSNKSKLDAKSSK